MKLRNTALTFQSRLQMSSFRRSCSHLPLARLQWDAQHVTRLARTPSKDKFSFKSDTFCHVMISYGQIGQCNSARSASWSSGSTLWFFCELRKSWVAVSQVGTMKLVKLPRISQVMSLHHLNQETCERCIWVLQLHRAPTKPLANGHHPQGSSTWCLHWIHHLVIEAGFGTYEARKNQKKSAVHHLTDTWDAWSLLWAEEWKQAVSRLLGLNQ